jgi:predicted DNA binding protein
MSGSHEAGVFDEFDAEAAEILCANAEAALDSLDRKSRLREHETALDRRMAELRQVTHVLGVARSALQAQFGADSRTRVEELSCDHLAAADAYRFAWVGRADDGDALEPVASSGVEEPFARGLNREIDDDPSITPGARAAATGSVVVVPDALEEPADGDRREDALERGYRSIAGVPIVHDEFTYGALEVYASGADRFDDRERSVLADLGHSLGYAIAAVDDSATTPDHLRVEATYRIEGETLFHWRLATDLDCRVVHRGTAGIDDDEATVFVEVDGSDPDAVRSAAEAAGVRDLRIVSENPVVAEARTAAPIALSTLSSHGGRLRSLSVDGGAGELTVAFPDRSSVRAVAEALSSHADSVDLATCETIDEDPVGISDPRAELLEALTDRQRELLQAAYVGGYFERSREISGEDLAASFDLNHSTVYEHLRAGQRALLGELFDPVD